MPTKAVLAGRAGSALWEAQIGGRVPFAKPLNIRWSFMITKVLSRAVLTAKRVYWPLMEVLPDRLAIQLPYLRAFKKLPNLKNPLTFNEKINWRKIYQHNPAFTVFSDKVAVKTHIAAIIGDKHVIPTLWVGDHPEDIPFDQMDPPYVIKVNHTSGGHIFIRSASDINKKEIFASINRLLRLNYAHIHREWGYLGIPRKVFVERMIGTAQGDIPADYKFYVYHGCAHFIHVDYDRFKDHGESFYDRDWRKLRTCATIRRPEHFDLMIVLVEKIGSLFDFVRVDFYHLPETVMFGEATFYPGACLEWFTPEKWDTRFGEPWRLPCA